MFNGKIHYFDWAIFNSFLYAYQRVVNDSSTLGLIFWWHFLAVEELRFQNGTILRTVSAWGIKLADLAMENLDSHIHV